MESVVSTHQNTNKSVGGFSQSAGKLIKTSAKNIETDEEVSEETTNIIKPRRSKLLIRIARRLARKHNINNDGVLNNHIKNKLEKMYNIIQEDNNISWDNLSRNLFLNQDSYLNMVMYNKIKSIYDDTMLELSNKSKRSSSSKERILDEISKYIQDEIHDEAPQTNRVSGSNNNEMILESMNNNKKELDEIKDLLRNFKGTTTTLNLRIAKKQPETAQPATTQPATTQPAATQPQQTSQINPVLIPGI